MQLFTLIVKKIFIWGKNMQIKTFFLMAQFGAYLTCRYFTNIRIFCCSILNQKQEFLSKGKKITVYTLPLPYSRYNIDVFYYFLSGII